MLFFLEISFLLAAVSYLPSAFGVRWQDKLTQTKLRAFGPHMNGVFWEAEFEGSDLNLAGWTKKLTGKDTITVGSVSLNADFLPEAGDKAFKDGEIANLDGLTKMLERDEFDLVAVGRAIIANPDWAQLVKAGQFDKLANFEKKMLMSLVS